MIITGALCLSVEAGSCSFWVSLLAGYCEIDDAPRALREFYPVPSNVKKMEMIMTASSEHLLVFTGSSSLQPTGRVERGVTSMLQTGLNNVEVTALKQNMTIFLDQLREILDTDASDYIAFEVRKVEVSAQITADGKVALLGSGGQIGVKGGITFVLERKAKASHALHQL